MRGATVLHTNHNLCAVLNPNHAESIGCHRNRRTVIAKSNVAIMVWLARFSIKLISPKSQLQLSLRSSEQCLYSRYLRERGHPLNTDHPTNPDVDAQSVGLQSGSRSRIPKDGYEGVGVLTGIAGQNVRCALWAYPYRTERTHGDERNGEQSNGSRCDSRNDLVVDRRRLVGCCGDRGVAKAALVQLTTRSATSRG